MTKKVLISGGPVYAYLDDVKIIGNKFSGGLMAELADNFVEMGYNVTYLYPKNFAKSPKYPNTHKVHHDGFDDYRSKVLELSPKMDAVVLGAAVANLIPKNKIVGKFPSHNYKVGDTIPIDFTIAPRIINEVKTVAPKTHLFGFKLLSGVDREELVRAAYGILLESKATAVIANDADDLTRKYIVTKERAVHEENIDNLALWLNDVIYDDYYRTEVLEDSRSEEVKNNEEMMLAFEIYGSKDKFTTTPEGYIFGTIAIRCEDGFITTGRGKKEYDSIAKVNEVDHNNRIVYSIGNKATLNAPLLDYIFKTNKNVVKIKHFHKIIPEYPIFTYAPSGTVRDSIRDIEGSFNTKNHGCYILYDNYGNIV